MTTLADYSNEKCRVLVVPDTLFGMRLPKDKPIIVIRASPEEIDVLNSSGSLPYRSADEAIDYLCGPTRLEGRLKYGKAEGKRFGRKELTSELDAIESISNSEEKSAEFQKLRKKYDLWGEEHSIFMDLAHGITTNANFHYDRGITQVHGFESMMNLGPNSDQLNLYEQFYSLCLFYDNHLGQQTCWANDNESRRSRKDRFFEFKTLEDANNHWKKSENWGRIKETFAKAGITTLEGIQDRVREFEKNFFPGEFEKAATEIRLTRAYLQSLKD